MRPPTYFPDLKILHSRDVGQVVPRQPTPQPFLSPNDLISNVLPARADLAVFRDVEAPWCPQMVALPAGEFLMGSRDSDKEGCGDERPQHQVVISTRIALGRYPVMFQEYDYFCDATKRVQPKDEGWGRRRRPVINVSWEDAIDYCEWLSRTTEQTYRLASEAEWEYACRAGTTMRYACGDDITAKDANFAESKLGKTTQVGLYPANPWGLYDMHGNVWEWTQDVWHGSYFGAAANGSPRTEGTNANPGCYRVIRGGSWASNPWALRSALRNRHSCDSRNGLVGFRIARTLR
jgi:formylglycine-generating enzyme required for sulfatase activity